MLHRNNKKKSDDLDLLRSKRFVKGLVSRKSCFRVDLNDFCIKHVATNWVGYAKINKRQYYLVKRRATFFYEKGYIARISLNIKRTNIKNEVVLYICIQTMKQFRFLRAKQLIKAIVGSENFSFKRKERNIPFVKFEAELRSLNTDKPSDNQVFICGEFQKKSERRDLQKLEASLSIALPQSSQHLLISEENQGVAFLKTKEFSDVPIYPGYFQDVKKLKLPADEEKVLLETGLSSEFFCEIKPEVDDYIKKNSRYSLKRFEQRLGFSSIGSPLGRIMRGKATDCFPPGVMRLRVIIAFYYFAYQVLVRGQNVKWVEFFDSVYRLSPKLYFDYVDSRIERELAQIPQFRKNKGFESRIRGHIVAFEKVTGIELL